jgi:hypothetical protein
MITPTLRGLNSVLAAVNIVNRVDRQRINIGRLGDMLSTGLVDRSGGLVLAGHLLASQRRVEQADALLVVGRGVVAPGDQVRPGLVVVLDLPVSERAVKELAVLGEAVRRLARRDLVDAEPVARGLQQAGHVRLDVVDVVELGGQRVVDVDGDDLPVALALVDEADGAQDFDLDDRAALVDARADLAHVQWIVVAGAASRRTSLVRICEKKEHEQKCYKENF